MSAQEDCTEERAGLPHWWYPAAYWAGVVLLAVSVLWPRFAAFGLAWLMLVPAGTAVRVFVHGLRRRDKELAASALVAVLGIALVFVLRNVIARR